MIDHYSSRLNIVYRELFRDVHLNPGEVYNYAATQASSETFFLTNPENMHLGDVLGEVEKYSVPNRYLCFSCANFFTIDSLQNILKDPSRYTDSAVPYYQHSELHNRMLHFASAIKKEDWEKIEGFDPIYNEGCAYEDNDFVEKLVKAGFEFYVFDNVGVAHLPHIRFTKDNLIYKNMRVFEKKWGFKTRDTYPEAKVTVFK